MRRVLTFPFCRNGGGFPQLIAGATGRVERPSTCSESSSNAEKGDPPMRKLLHYSVRFLAIVAVVAALSLLLTPPLTTRCPYLSALSDWAATQALASATCSDRACSANLIQCAHMKGFNCRRIDRCSDTACS